MSKKCGTCGRTRNIREFSRRNSKTDILKSECKSCSLDRTRAWRASCRTNYARFCGKAYSGIKERCTSLRGRHVHIYYGLPYCTRKEFLAWANQPAIKAEWESLAAVWRTTRLHGDIPSIDRLSAHVKVGYVPYNMRWCSHRDNAAKAQIQRHHGRSACPPDFTKELACA